MSTHPFIPVPNTAQVNVLMRQDGQQIENVFHYEGDVPWTDALLSDLASNVMAEWIAHIIPVQVSNVTLVGAIARSLESLGAPAVEVSMSPVSGTLTGSALPTSVTFAIKWITGLAGRSFRGRTYHIGLSSAYVTGNTITDAALTDLLEAYSAFKTAVEVASNVTQVVVSLRNALAWRTSGVTTPIITTAAADQNIDSQRRRLTGRGK